MNRIFAMHGSVRNRREGLLTHANYIDETLFENHLKNRPAKYVSVEKALAGEGEALTIDDATEGAKQAALLARAHGHEVTIFVNRYFVLQRRRHFFHPLNHLIDSICTPTVRYDGNLIETATPLDRKRLKKLFKKQYCTLPNIEDREALVERCLAALGGDNHDNFPKHAETLTLEDMAGLHSAGVALENHGDDHVHYNCIDEERRSQDLMSGSDWLRGLGYAQQHLFAVPFGDPLPGRSNSPTQCAAWLLEYSGYPHGRFGAQRWKSVVAWNRTPLVI